jgi:hypothetical protein
MPLSAVMPLGEVWLDHVAPPLDVLRIATPGPPDEEPTAVQSSWLKHEMAVKFATVPGIDSWIHETPLFVVAMMLGEPEPYLLTAWQIDTLTQSTAVRTPTPAGTDSVDQVDPAFDVPITIGLPKMPKPTAVQFDGVGHEIPLIPLTAAGIDCECQEEPLSVDHFTESVPAAKQIVVLGQATDEFVVPLGTTSSDQARPLVVVEMITEPVPVVPESPTPMQSSLLKQEIPVRSTASAGGDSADQLDPVLDV